MFQQAKGFRGASSTTTHFPRHRGDCAVTLTARRGRQRLWSLLSFRSGTLTKTKFQPCGSSENVEFHTFPSHRVTDDCADCWWARPLTPPLTTASPSLVPTTLFPCQGVSQTPPSSVPPRAPPTSTAPSACTFFSSFLPFFFFFTVCYITCYCHNSVPLFFCCTDLFT